MARVTRTAAEVIVRALIAEEIPWVLGIFGHGNVQLSQALHDHRDEIRYVSVKNEQNAVHIAAAHARLTGRPLAVTTSVGPGATNLVTGAAAARVNRLPVLLLPGEVFADGVGPVLQQIEGYDDRTANDTLRPVSKYWTRVTRPEQLARRLREAFDAMLEPGDEGPATICLPMDLQAEAADFDLDRILAPRDRRYARPRPDRAALEEAIAVLAASQRPLIVAGGGVLRSGAEAELVRLAEALGAPVVATQAGMGAMPGDHPLSLWAAGPCGTLAGNRAAREADVVLGIGTRWSDFTTASETAFAPEARFVNVNIAAIDVGKERALKLRGDARETIDALRAGLPAPVSASDRSAWRTRAAALREAWLAEADRWRAKDGRPLPQSGAIGLLNEILDPGAIIVAAAGSLPGDLQRLWRPKDPHGYICEYGYSTMGFEVAGGLGARLARPDAEVVVLVGDLSFLMASQELVTAVQLGLAYTVVVFDNHGGQSIRHLQRRAGFTDFAMELDLPGGGHVPIDFVRLAEGMGARGLLAEDRASLHAAIETARAERSRPTVVHLHVDKEDLMGGYEGWWDVPPLAVDPDGRPNPGRADYLAARARRTLR